MDSTATAEPAAVDQAAFSFVKDLAYQFNRREAIEIPSFPDIAMRVKRVLEDERSSADKIARVVGSEPGLATRLLKMANSAALNVSGREILDVKTAVNRLGDDHVRASATGFAMKNLMDTRTVAELKPYLRQLWNHSLHVAAIAYALGRRTERVNPDEAMFVGLVHDIGKLYILTRIENYPALFACADTMEHVINDWHTSIGKTILENWGFPEHVLDAVDLHEEHDRKRYGEPDLADVVIVANLFSNLISNRHDGPLDFDRVRSCRRLEIGQQEFHEVMIESKDQIEEFMSALRG